MFEPEQYELIDFGAGRKLERFGTELVDRPCPAADGIAIADPEGWGRASARFDQAPRAAGQWSVGGEQPSPVHRSASVDGPSPADAVPGGAVVAAVPAAAVAVAAAADVVHAVPAAAAAGGGADAGSAASSAIEEGLVPWSVCHGRSRLLLQQSASGNVGLFPEQAANWVWIASQVDRCRNAMPKGRPRVLNLFGYTGGASLAAAAAGAEVTHVDASAPTVAWAKRNAEASGMADLPIRWLVEDAIRFAQRECRRGNRYEGVIADPPTYGHGPKGRAFKFAQHLPELLALCGELLGTPPESRADGRPPSSPTGRSDRFLVFSCHAPGFGPDDAASAVSSVLPTSDGARIAGRPLVLESRDGRKLAAGVSVRWHLAAPNDGEPIE